MEPKIGDRVRATMNGTDWFTGEYVKESDTLAQYGVKRDDMPNEIRFFTHAEKLQDAGMYAVNDPSYPQVKVGDFTICRQDDQSVWIQREGGEGGQFSDAAFSDALEAFWREHF